MRHFFTKIILTSSVLSSTASYGFDAITMDKRTSLFSVTDKTVPVVSAKYIGWGANWKWAGARMKPGGAIRKDKSSLPEYTGEIKTLDIAFSSAARPNNNQVIWTYNWHKKTNVPDATGFGIAFNLKLDSASFTKPAEKPSFLPNNQGWRWQTPDGQSLEVKFSPALAKIDFEKNQPNKIRALFFTAVKQGDEETTMTVTVSGNNTRIANAMESVENSADTENWHKDILSATASPIDLSFLNANDLPAGKHGYVKAQADKLVFADGVPTKFWGINIMAYALFKTPDNDIKIHAKRLAQLGYNLVRIHHHDSAWVKPNIFNNPENNTQDLSTEAFKKLDIWIKRLKDEGIYLWLDLHVGRKVTKSDGVDKFEELAKGKNNGDIKGFNYYNESIQKQMQRFNETYLNHVNPLTGLTYKNDPAVIALLITNENDLTQHFGNLFLPNKGVPQHTTIFKDDINRFSANSSLSSKKAGATWQMGESKIYLGDVEHRFNQKMLAHLRGLGAKSMIATTNSWGYMGLFGLPSLTEGDLIDSHSYGKAEEFKYNPRYNPGFLTWIGAAQVTAKPLSVSEWNTNATPPVEDRFTMPLYVASIADLQGWDAMMMFGYSQASLGNATMKINWSTFNDPSITGLMPAAALLYRQTHVAPAKQNYELKLSKDDFFYKKQDPTTSKTIRTLLETSRFTVTVPETKELPWLKSSKPIASVITDANKDFIPEGQNFVQSDTGELKRDWAKGIHTIDTAKSQIASGWIGGEKINLRDISFEIDTKQAVVAVQSLENKPLNQSKTIFITLMAHSETANDGKKLPFLSEPVVGEITISAPTGLKLFPLNSSGKKEDPIKINYAKGKYHIKLDNKNHAHWFLLSVS